MKDHGANELCHEEEKELFDPRSEDFRMCGEKERELWEVLLSWGTCARRTKNSVCPFLSTPHSISLCPATSFFQAV